MSSRRTLYAGQISGIRLRIHWTFSLLVIGLFVFYLSLGRTVGESLFGVGLILVLFACIVLHELGHTFAARGFGIQTRDITLYPIGGLARLERIPEDPKQEFLISMAGPAVNLLIAAVLAAGIGLFGQFPSVEQLAAPTGHFAGKLMWFNVIIAAFNLLPAFPMDGGRILRALLATQMEYLRATQIASRVGQAMALLFAFLGFATFNPILLFIALFVFLGAQQEARAATMRQLLEGIPVEKAMTTRFEVLSPQDTLFEAACVLIGGAEQAFLVADRYGIHGILSRKRMINALAERGGASRVADVMKPPGLVLEATTSLDVAFQQMMEAEATMVPVMDEGVLVGMLTPEGISQWIAVRSALERAQKQGNQGTLVAS